MGDSCQAACTISEPHVPLLNAINTCNTRSLAACLFINLDTSAQIYNQYQLLKAASTFSELQNTHKLFMQPRVGNTDIVST